MLSAADHFANNVARTLPDIRAFALRLCRDPDKADDLLQETALKALAHRDQFKIGTNLAGWLTTIAKNHFLSMSRRDGRIVDDPEGDRTAKYSLDDGSAGEDGDELNAVETVLDALPAPMRKALDGIADGDSYDATAERLGVEVGTVKSRVNRARNILADVRGTRKVRKRNVIGAGQEIRPIDIKRLQRVEAKDEIGGEPSLEWIPITSLRIDGRYQRGILERGLANVYRIAREFDWRKFQPVIVARCGPYYAIVDGQHRTYAAALRGIEKVPCMVTDATLAEQAAAFSAINGQTTRIHELQVHAAAVMAGDSVAVSIDTACKVAGVEVCRYPVPEGSMKPKQTLALGALRRVFKDSGQVGLTLTLRAIAEAHPTDRGAFRAQIINAMGYVVAKYDELTPREVLAVAGGMNFITELTAARIAAATEGRSITSVLRARLDAKFGVPA